jgi:hypothetical protein
VGCAHENSLGLEIETDRILRDFFDVGCRITPTDVWV